MDYRHRDRKIHQNLDPTHQNGRLPSEFSNLNLKKFHVEHNLREGFPILFLVDEKDQKAKEVLWMINPKATNFTMTFQFLESEIPFSKVKCTKYCLTVSCPHDTDKNQERRRTVCYPLSSLNQTAHNKMVLSTSQVTLKSSQLKAVHRMLAFNEDVDAIEDDFSLPPAGSSHNQWKILIYDKECRSIISPLLSVSQLRRRGVTLHLLLNSEREPIPDVPAVYFCRPTKENLSIIAQDCAKKLYGRCHLNFVTKLDRQLMEDFAKLVVQSGSLDTIAGIHDQYLDFVCLEQQLFSLAQKDSYALINGSGVNEQMIEEAMTNIAYGLFSVIATQGKVPIIRCPKVRTRIQRGTSDQ